MKYFFFSIAILLIACSSNTPSSKAVSTTKGGDDIENPIMGGPVEFTIKTDGQNGKVQLIGFYLDQNVLFDTTVMTNGVIHFKKDEGYPQGLYYVGVPSGEYIQVVLPEDQKFNMECKLGDLMGSMKVEGSTDNELFYKVAKFETAYQPKIADAAAKVTALSKGSAEYKQALRNRLDVEAERERQMEEILKLDPNGLFAKFKRGGQNPRLNIDLDEKAQVVQYRKDFWNGVDFSDRRLVRTPMIGNKLKRYMTELTAQNQDSINISADDLMSKVENAPEYFKLFANWIVLKYEPTKCALMDPEGVFVHMVRKYFTYEKAFWQDSLMTKTILGRANEMAQSRLNEPAPNVISTDLMGQKVELLSSKAPYIVVYMFNPECEHCQEETPKLIDYYNANKGKVDVFAIAIETEDKKWKDYAKKLNFPFRSVYDPTNRSIYAKYYVDITPELYVISPERKIIGKNLKVFQIETVIKQDESKR